MKKDWKRGLYILLASSLITSCSARKQVVSSHFRPLNEQELQAEATKQNAEIIIQFQDQDSTFVVLDTEDSIKHGYLQVKTYDFSDQTSSSSVAYSLTGTASRLNAKVDVMQGATNQGSRKTIDQGYVVAIVQDEALQQELQNFRLTFPDQSQTTVTASDESGLYFTYDVPTKKQVVRLELLSESNEVLYSTDL